MGPACDDDGVPTTPQPKRQDYLRGSPDQIKGDCPKKIPADFPGRMLTPAQYAEIAKLRKMFRTRQGNPHGPPTVRQLVVRFALGRSAKSGGNTEATSQAFHNWLSVLCLCSEHVSA